MAVLSIGLAEVVSVNERMSAVRVIQMKEGFLLKVGDTLLLAREDNE